MIYFAPLFLAGASHKIVEMVYLKLEPKFWIRIFNIFAFLGSMNYLEHLVFFQEKASI